MERGPPLSRQGKDVRLAVLVACSVEKGKGHGGDRRSDQRNDCYVEIDPTEKVSARRFAAHADCETTAPRVLRHLTAWDSLAADGLVPPAADLTPAEVRNVRNGPGDQRQSMAIVAGFTIRLRQSV